MKVKSGEFKHPIIIQRCEQIVNEDNIPTENWNDLLIARAKIVNTTGKEYMAMNGQVSSTVTKFTIRAPKQTEITTKDRLVYNGKHYNIKHCNNIMELDVLLEIVAEVLQ